MCLAIPSKVLAIKGDRVIVERYGERLEANTGLMTESLTVGDYVVVRARTHVVAKMEPQAAREALSLFAELAEMGQILADLGRADAQSLAQLVRRSCHFFFGLHVGQGPQINRKTTYDDIGYCFSHDRWSSRSGSLLTVTFTLKRMVLVQLFTF